MKGVIIFILIFCFTSIYGQEIINYRVKQKNIPILERTNGRMLARVPRNQAITFIEYTDSCGCFLVQYKNITGVIDSSTLLADVFGDNLSVPGQTKIMNDLKNTLDPERKTDELKRKSEFIRKYGYPEGIKVSEKKIWIGMTVDMTLDSWGIPYKVNRSNSEWGKREQWIYSNVYLYFENGVLAEIMTIRQSAR